MTLQHAVIPGQSLAEGDRVMCGYAGDTPLDMFEMYTVTNTIMIGQEHYITLDDHLEGPWARWRFVRITGGQ